MLSPYANYNAEPSTAPPYGATPTASAQEALQQPALLSGQPPPDGELAAAGWDLKSWPPPCSYQCQVPHPPKPNNLSRSWRTGKPGSLPAQAPYLVDARSACEFTTQPLAARCSSRAQRAHRKLAAGGCFGRVKGVCITNYTTKTWGQAPTLRKADLRPLGTRTK